jgi:hypothetical protein
MLADHILKAEIITKSSVGVNGGLECHDGLVGGDCMGNLVRNPEDLLEIPQMLTSIRAHTSTIRFSICLSLMTSTDKSSITCGVMLCYCERKWSTRIRLGTMARKAVWPPG